MVLITLTSAFHYTRFTPFSLVLPVFKTGAFVRSAIPPQGTYYCITDFRPVQREARTGIRAFDFYWSGLHPSALEWSGSSYPMIECSGGEDRWSSSNCRIRTRLYEAILEGNLPYAVRQGRTAQ